MKKNEIIFSYNKTRCHATIVSEKPADVSDNRYIGEIDGYEIYSLSVLFNQFGFIAIDKKEK